MEIQPIIKEKSLRIKRSEVTRDYRISKSTLRRLNEKGKLKPVGRITEGSELVYDRAEVEEYQRSLL